MSYIGATTQSLAKRCGEHRAQAKEGRSHPLAVAIRSDGWESFAVETLGNFETLAELHAAERATIAAMKTITPYGYNRASGGMGTPDCNHSDETKRKIAAVHLGKKDGPSWNKGLSMSDEFKRKQSETHLGQRAWNKGLQHSDEARRRMSEAHLRSAHPVCRPVEVEGKSFPSLAEAMRGLGLSKMQVRYKLMTGRARYLQKG